MDSKAKYKADKLADEHTEWFTKTIAMIYRDAFIHGFKHGFEYATQLNNIKS